MHACPRSARPCIAHHANLVCLGCVEYLETRVRENVNAKKNADVRNKAKSENESIHPPYSKNSFTHVKQIHAWHVIALQACHANELHAIHANKLASLQPIARNSTIHAPFTISACIGERKKTL